MMSRLLFSLLWAIVSLSLLAKAGSPSIRAIRAPSRITAGGVRRSTLAPANDPFYKPPAGFESTPLGTVLRSRTVSVAALGFDPVNVEAYQLLYHTQGANSTTFATVTTVFKPSHATTPALVAYSTAEDSVASICSPSYNYQLGNPQTDVIITIEFLLLEALLQQGWTVTSSDHEGPDGCFTSGRLEGHAVLDSIRAALSFQPLGLSARTPTAGWGYSGGAVALGWAAALQPSYAPELNIIGWTHGGTPANISGSLAFLDGTLFSGFGPAGIIGLSKSYQSINDLITQIETPLAKLGIQNVIEKQCALADVIAFAFEKVQSYVWTTLGPKLLYDSRVKAVTDQLILGRVASETPEAPLYVYHALDDEIIPIADMDRTVSAYCANGIKSLVYDRDIGVAEHISMEILGAPKAILYLKDRFNGVAAPSGCTTNNIQTTLSDPNVLGEASAIIIGDLITLLTHQIGSNDGIWTGGLQRRRSR